MKLWAGRFTKNTNLLVDEYTASINFDYKLAKYDIEGSIAHVNMLAMCGFITQEEANLIQHGLVAIKNKIQRNEMTYSISDEDIHMNIERMLHEEIGEVAGKLHTGRSRNDQVALDIHLYLRHQTIIIVKKLHDLLNTIYTLASEHIDTLMPGYTHLQRAEPVRFAHHMLAYFNMYSRDISRLCDSFSRVNICPLGAGALAGSGLPVDRMHTAQLLKFDGLYENSLDAVSDRDFIVEFLSISALIMMHFSRFSEEIILWCSQEFSFIQLDDAFCTGSSMMPQKKNPDVAELARGKTGRVYGALMGLLTTLKGLPLAYNKDMQEDKEGLFDTVTTINQTITVFNGMLQSMKVDANKMRHATETDFSNATQLANYLTNKKIPFRSAHEITGKIILHCIDNHVLLKDLPLKSYQQFCEKIESDIYAALSIEAVIEAHTVRGGTSALSVQHQLALCRDKMDDIQEWINQHNQL